VMTQTDGAGWDKEAQVRWNSMGGGGRASTMTGGGECAHVEGAAAPPIGAFFEREGDNVAIADSSDLNPTVVKGVTD
jgi:hypothetical protein